LPDDGSVVLQLEISLPYQDDTNRIELVNAIPELLDIFFLPFHFTLKGRNLIGLGN